MPIAPEGSMILLLDTTGVVPYEKALKLNETATLQAVINTQKKGGRELVKGIKSRFLSGNPINRRTGRLQRSIYTKTFWKQRGEQVDTEVGSTSPYFITHFEGRTIVPRHDQWLSVPVRGGLTGFGKKRFQSPLKVFHPGEFHFIPHGYKALLLHVPSQQITHMLVRSVTVPGRLRVILPKYIENFMKYRLIPKLTKIIQRGAEGKSVPKEGL